LLVIHNFLLIVDIVIGAIYLHQPGFKRTTGLIGWAQSFFGALFFYKKKRFSAKIRFRRIFAQITFTQCFNCVNCAGEAVKDEIIPTRPTKAAPMHQRKQLIYDSHPSTPHSDF
jgi:hypothetical protein